MKKLAILIPAFLTTCVNLFAQPTPVPTKIYFPSTDVKVTQNNNAIISAWSGGMNNPQLAMADLNNDGVTDLVMYEQYLGVKTFINKGTNGNPVYEYNFNYEKNFPDNIQDYLKLVDYNRDNKPDLIHKGNSGYSVYQGYYNNNNELCFSFYRDLYYLLNNGWVNAYAQPSAIPGVGDVDGDGDIDFFSYDVWGSVIYFYRNCQVEDHLSSDSIRICVKDICWGKTRQLNYRNQLLASPCQEWGVTCKTTKKTDGANSICLVDIDGDGDMDYFNGNNAYSDIQFLKNGKNETNYAIDTMIAQDTSWSGNGHKMQFNNSPFPAAFWLDIDNDGDKDLLFTPYGRNAENHKCIQYFKNTGSDAHPNFVFQTDSLFTDQTIDVGFGSYPVFYDYNRDGKPDLFIGSDGYWQSGGTNISRLSLYLNNSSKGSPSFAEQSTDFLNISSLSLSGSAPAFGDLDGDGLDDMVLGLTDGTIVFFKNTAASNNATPNWHYQGRLQIPDINNNPKNIDVGKYAAPLIYDIDTDGKADLLVGCFGGTLYYFKNQNTTAGQVSLKQITDKLGGVDIATQFEPNTYTVPFIGKIDDSGKPYLMIGTAMGVIYQYTGFENGNVTKPYTAVDTAYQSINIGSRAAPAFTDIDGDGLFEAVIGNELGGVKLFKQFFNVGIRDVDYNNQNISVYPNPATNSVTISWNTAFSQSDVEISIVSVTGQKMVTLKAAANQQKVVIPVQDMATGVYYCIVQSGTNKSVKPVTIIR